MLHETLEAKYRIDKGVWVLVECPRCKFVTHRTISYYQALGNVSHCPKCHQRMKIEDPTSENMNTNINQGQDHT
jgi:predicted Zn-ribbon and HTH transcriptional regulator